MGIGEISFSHLKVVGSWLIPLGWSWLLGAMLVSGKVVPCLVCVCNIFCNGIVMDGDVILFFYQLPASLSLSFLCSGWFFNVPWFSFLFQHITMNPWRQVQTLQHKSLICMVFELQIWNFRVPLKTCLKNGLKNHQLIATHHELQPPYLDILAKAIRSPSVPRVSLRVSTFFSTSRATSVVRNREISHNKKITP